MLKDPSERLRRAIKDNNLYLVRRIIERNSEPQEAHRTRRQRPSHRLDVRNPDPGAGRYTSLAWAAVYGHEEIFEYLLNIGHDEEELSRDAENNTILILLAGVRNAPGTSQGRDYDPQDTALRMARLYHERYPYLIDWSNVYGKTALHVAATKGNEGFVRMFCDLEADFDLPDLQGNTPLHYASAWNHVSVMQLLIERGCQFAARNNEGFTASDYAFSFNTMNTLQETARAQFENNKRARRHIFQQAAARGVEREKRDPTATQISSRDERSPIDPTLNRLRSGSGGSKAASVETLDIPRQNVSGSLTPANNGTRTPSSALSPQIATATNGTSKPPSQLATPNMLTSPLPAASVHAISPVASRMRERDADAMAEYLKRTRSGSGGGTNSPAATIQNSTDAMPIAPVAPAPPKETTAPYPPQHSVTLPPERRRAEQSKERGTTVDLPGSDGDRIEVADALQSSAFRPLRRLRPSNSSASLRPTGIIGMPPGSAAAGHAHSNSAMEVDLIAEVLGGINDSGETYHSSFLPSMSPVAATPLSAGLSPLIEATRPLDIKPRQRPTMVDPNTPQTTQTSNGPSRPGEPCSAPAAEPPRPPLKTVGSSGNTTSVNAPVQRR